MKGACKGEQRLVEGKAADVQHTEVFASTLIVTTCCKGRVALYFIDIFLCFLKLFSQPRAFAPKDLFNAFWSVLQRFHYIMHLRNSCCCNNHHASFLCFRTADSGENLLGPASIICSACNACCHSCICSTADRPESIHFMRCAVTTPSDPVANLRESLDLNVVA